MSAIGMLLVAWAIAAGAELVLWLISLRTRNAAIVDLGWAGSFVLVVVTLAAASGRPLVATAPVVAMVGLWSVRLTLHLALRGAAGRTEEGRYRELRRRWSPNADRAFFVFFQAQALLVAVLTLAFVWPFAAAPARGTGWQIVGGAIWLVAIVGETVADAQLTRWKRRADRGPVCDVGLWRYSRHPNYFFETLIWVGLATYASAFPFGALAWVAPVLIFASIWKVSGIPATEAQAIRSRGDAYRAYQARTSAFVPWPPKELP